jgi:hypothetical protein
MVDDQETKQEYRAASGGGLCAQDKQRCVCVSAGQGRKWPKKIKRGAESSRITRKVPLTKLPLDQFGNIAQPPRRQEREPSRGR